MDAPGTLGALGEDCSNSGLCSEYQFEKDFEY